MAGSVLCRLREDGISIARRGDKLLVNPSEGLTDVHRQMILDHKAELMADLAAESRRHQLLKLLESRPHIKRVFLVEPLPGGGGLVSLGVRGIGTCELLIQKGPFQPQELVKLFDELGVEDGAGSCVGNGTTD